MSRIKSDEQLLFFPTAARLSEDRQSWVVPVHGWIFEPEDNNTFRGRLVREIFQALGVRAEPTSKALFDKRIRWFLVDNERGKRFSIRVGQQTFALNESDSGGHFTATIKVPIGAVGEQLADHRLGFVCVTDPSDSRDFRGVAFCLPPEGTSVISDIDDTIKITEVTDRTKLLENTFFREFRAVDGMAAVYKKWADAGAHFHFVSSSPWQLYQPLSVFATEAGFPEGTYHMRRFRLKDSSFLQLLENPIPYKVAIIESIIQNYPKRTFVLVGDSGEKDPEIYGIVARRYSDQVKRIYIRNVTEESAESSRFENAFREVPFDRWSLFDDASQLERTDDGQ